MGNKKIIRKNKGTLNLTSIGHKYGWGGQSLSTFNNAFEGSNLGSSLGSIGSGISGIASAGINNAKIKDTSGISANIDKANTFQSNAVNNDDLMAEWGAYNPMEDINYRDLMQSKKSSAMNTIGGTMSGAASGATIGGPIGAVVGGVAGLFSGLFGRRRAKRKAKRKARALNEQIDLANEFQLASLENNAENIDAQNDLNMLSDFYAEGGPIHIKKANRGKFTDYCGGKVTQECINRGKNSPNPLTRRRATFADNARHWHSCGGKLFAMGGDINNGVDIIGNGYSHEENPLGGVPMGMAPDGQPNLVEEGEVKYNNYIYSNRLAPNETLLEEVGLPNKYKDHSFAWIAERISKESEERPNDPISKRGLEDSMGKLAIAQEYTRYNNEEDTQVNGNTFADGGPYNTYSNYTNINNDWYTPEYMGFVNSLKQGNPSSMNWLNRINKEEFGPIGGNTIKNIDDLKRLATDRKRGPIHNAMLAASSQYKNETSPIEITKGIESLDNPMDLSLIDNNLSPVTHGRTRKERGPLSLDFLRYAPAIGSGISAIGDMFSSPDYSNAEAIERAYDNIPYIGYEPINRYLQYKPFDRNYYTNKLGAQSQATRRAIVDQAGGNRANAVANLLALDYNTQGRLGDLFRQAEEYNLAQREKTEAFNRDTDRINRDLAYRAETFNRGIDERKAAARTAGAQFREDIASRYGAARSANITNFLDNLGAIGHENTLIDMINSNPALLYELSKGKKVKYKRK